MGRLFYPCAIGFHDLNDRCCHALSALYVYLQVTTHFHSYTNNLWLSAAGYSPSQMGTIVYSTPFSICTSCANIHYPKLTRTLCFQMPCRLPYNAVVKYIDLIRCLKSTIALREASDRSDPPESLTVSTHEFLKVGLAISSASWLWSCEYKRPPLASVVIFGQCPWHESHWLDQGVHGLGWHSRQSTK